MLPDHYVGYTINSGRGTLDLIWSCLVTIVLCTWTVQRLQVVPCTASKNAIFRKKAFWFPVTLLCPEYVAWIAFEQWQRARKYKEVYEMGHKDWTMQHGFYVDMGGLQVKLEGCSPYFLIGKENRDILKLDDGVRFTIRLDDLILLLKADLLSIPNICIHDLEERSKNDQSARVITSLQVLYFVVQVFGRLGSDLPISTLEISTLAFVCCAALIEYFWWDKPLDLRTATVTTLSPENNARFISILPQLRFNAPEQDLADRKDFRLFFDRMLRGSEMNKNIIYGVWIGFIFNSIHISAWNYSFASKAEQLLWRITSLGTCGAVVFLWIATFIHSSAIRLILSSLSTIFYYTCRVYLIVEVFVSLRSVPGALYETAAWQNALPGV